MNKLLANRYAIALLVLVLLATAVFSFGVMRSIELPEPGQRYERLLVVDAQLVNLDTGNIEAGTNVLIEGGKIIGVGTDLRKQLEGKSFTTMNVKGGYLIPGLFDMHVHSLRLSPALHHPLYIANGVTAVRDMGGCLDDQDPWIACAPDKRSWNIEADQGQRVAPRYDVVTGLAVDGGQEIPSGFDPGLGVPDADHALMRVLHDQARQLDFIKPYSSLSRPAYLALAADAEEFGLYLAGHKPFAVTGLDAVAAGQRSIEHAFLFIWECYPGMAELRRGGDIKAAFTPDMRQRMIAQHDRKSCKALQHAMKESGTAFVPTHTTRKLDAYAAESAFRDDPRLRYIPGPLKMLWQGDADNMVERGGDGGAESYRAFYEFGLSQTGSAYAAGVRIMAGSDAPDSFVFPGSGLHDELEHLVQAGLSPLAALRAATVEPARFLDLAGQAGVIAPGARADLVVLKDNPLEDINAVRTVDTVILSGAIYDRRELDKLLEGVATAAGRWDLWPKFLWQGLRSPIMRKQFAD